MDIPRVSLFTSPRAYFDLKAKAKLHRRSESNSPLPPSPADTKGPSAVPGVKQEGSSPTPDCLHHQEGAVDLSTRQRRCVTFTTLNTSHQRIRTQKHRPKRQQHKINMDRHRVKIPISVALLCRQKLNSHQLLPVNLDNLCYTTGKLIGFELRAPPQVQI